MSINGNGFDTEWDSVQATIDLSKKRYGADIAFSDTVEIVVLVVFQAAVKIRKRQQNNATTTPRINQSSFFCPQISITLTDHTRTADFFCSEEVDRWMCD